MNAIQGSPPVPRPSKLGPSKSRAQRTARRKRWPTWVIAFIGIAGAVTAFVAFNTLLTPLRLAIASAAFAIVLIGGTTMLFVQRVLDVGVARSTGTPLLARFDLGDKVAFGLLLVASVANGVVIALQVARQ